MFDRVDPLVGVAQIVPGPELVDGLAAVDRGRLDGHDLVTLIRARARLLSWMQAQLWADVAALGRAEPTGPGFDHSPGFDEAMGVGAGVRTRDDFAADELRPALALTRRGAETCLGYARDICERLPAVWSAAMGGKLDRRRAEIFVDETARLTEEQARLVVDKLVDRAGGWTTSVLRQRIRELIMVIAPEQESDRRQDAVKHRVVWGQSNDDGTITFTGDRLPTIEAAKAMARIRGLARVYRAAGDPRNLDQLAADLYLALLNGEPLPDPDTATVCWAEEPDRPVAADRSTDPEPAPADPADPAPTGPTTTDPAPSHPAPAEVTPAGAGTADGIPAGPAPTGPAPTGPAPTGPAPVPRSDESGLARLANAASIVELTVPITTLMGLADTPADLAGWGPVIADIARQFTRDHHTGQWHWTVSDPDSHTANPAPSNGRRHMATSTASSLSRPPASSNQTGPV